MNNRFSEISMRVFPECYPCFVRQANIAMEVGGVNGDTVPRVMKSVFRCLERADYSNKTPAHVTSAMHRRIRRLLKADPFRGVKARYNAIALKMYPELKEKVATSPRPLITAARLAIAGNIIDFGIYDSVDIMGTVERALDLNSALDVDDSDDFLLEVEEKEQVLYLLDNSGEVVFDRILIEELIARGRNVTAVVKAGPVINDCTMEDATGAGLAGLCKIIDNGSDHVGTILEQCSMGFQERFGRRDQLVISKGQGNFETLMHEGSRIYFLFQAKCLVVARLLGLGQGAMLLARGGKS